MRPLYSIILDDLSLLSKVNDQNVFHLLASVLVLHRQSSSIRDRVTFKCQSFSIVIYKYQQAHVGIQRNMMEGLCCLPKMDSMGFNKIVKSSCQIQNETDILVCVIQQMQKESYTNAKPLIVVDKPRFGNKHI